MTFLERGVLLSGLVLGSSLVGCRPGAPGAMSNAAGPGSAGEQQPGGGAGISGSQENGGTGALTAGTNGLGGTAAGGTAGTGGHTSAGGPGGGGQGTDTAAAGAMSSAGSGEGGATGGAGGGSGASAGGASADGGTGSTFHVFLLLGQSNMAGYPKAQDADKVENPRIKVLGYDDCAATGRRQDEWDVAVPPLHECWNGAIGPADYFSKAMLDAIPEGDTIGLVPCAISGERIETFLKEGGTKYAWILERARLAQQAGGVIEGILFHQGESNNGDPSWPGKVNTLITDLRADLAIGDVPFLAGELAYDGGCAGHNRFVNMLPMVVTNAYVVSASGLALDPADTQWRLHFGRDAQITFGQRYAETMIEALQ